MSVPVDIEVIRAFLRTAYNGANEEYIDKFTPFILGNQTEKVIDLGVHFRVVRCSSKHLAKVLIQKEMEDDEYIIQTVGSRHVQQLLVAVKGFKKLLKIKDIDAHKVYRDMEKRVKAYVVNMQENPVNMPTPEDVPREPGTGLSTPTLARHAGNATIELGTPLEDAYPDNLIVNELRATFAEGEKLRFIKIFYKYLRCNDADIIIDLDDVADLLGSSKAALVTKIDGARRTDEFIENQHYKKVGGRATVNGRLPTKYYVTTSAFKRVCLLSQTTKGADLWMYFNKMESIVRTILANVHAIASVPTGTHHFIETHVETVHNITDHIVDVPSSSTQSATNALSRPRQQVTTLVPILKSNFDPIHGMHVTYKPSKGTYIIEHGHCKTTGKIVLEYGEGFVNDRVRKHLQENKHARVVILASVGSADSLAVEQTIKSVVTPYLVDIKVNGKNKKEYFACEPDVAPGVMQDIVDTVSRVHGQLLIRLEFGGIVIVDKTQSADNILEIEREKRMAEEAKFRKRALDMIESRPDKFDELIKLLA